jgi:putative addiction module component (TIGR02574 family)
MLLVMSTITKAEILSLSVPERIQLAEDIWDTIAEVPEAISLSDDEKAELDRRLDAYHRDPTAGSPWEAVRRKIRDRA